MTDELQRTAELIERLLADPELRRRFRADAAAVLVEAGLPELAGGLGQGERALMTLDLRESRSSLAGVMVAAAAEMVDFAQLAEHAAPALARDAGGEMHRLGEHHAAHHPAAHSARDAAADPAGAAKAHKPIPKPVAKPTLGEPVRIPRMATKAPPAAPEAHAHVDAASAHHSRSSASRPSAVPVDAGASIDTAPAYPGDAASPEQLAVWMGERAQQAGLPPELPVMAALTESGLHNLSYGDRDSVGFFQMRLGIWNQGPYAGYPDHPELQLQWFIDHALAVKQQYPALAASPSSWGEWVANVEQPAAAYRYRYQLQLGTAQSLLHDTNPAAPGGSAEAPGTPAPAPGTAAPAPATAAPAPATAAPAPAIPAPAPAAPAPTPVPPGQGALKVFMSYLDAGGRRGASLHSGPDSAGLVQFAYARQGLHVPGVAAEQFDIGTPVSRGALHPGDAVFFSRGSGYIDHVGLYVGNGRFISESGKGVTISSLHDPGFAGHYAGARRYTVADLVNPSSFARPMPTLGSGASATQ